MEIRDELAMLRYARLIAQVPLLYVTLITIVLAAMLAASTDSPLYLRVGLPLTIATMAAVRLIWWLRRPKTATSPAQARRLILRLIVVSSVISLLCSLWCVISWLMSAPEERAYFVMIIAMGALSTAFCLSVVRAATLFNLAIPLIPISLTLLATGNEMDIIAAAIILIAAAFLLRLIIQEHQQLIDLLILKHHFHEQANTDPLTGLMNRRALLASMQNADRDETMAIALVDLNAFKPVNDQHGHAAGDELLVQVAQRMKAACGDDAQVARVGGDEFAILLLGHTAPRMAMAVDHMLSALAKPFVVNDIRLSIGASAGMAQSTEEMSSVASLMAAADRALYAAKAAQHPASSPAAPAITLSERRG
ncbi:MAG: diguanylate cyclase, partial [Sphingopyxis sp.]